MSGRTNGGAITNFNWILLSKTIRIYCAIILYAKIRNECYYVKLLCDVQPVTEIETYIIMNWQVKKCKLLQNFCSSCDTMRTGNFPNDLAKTAIEYGNKRDLCEQNACM